MTTTVAQPLTSPNGFASGHEAMRRCRYTVRPQYAGFCSEYATQPSEWWFTDTLAGADLVVETYPAVTWVVCDNPFRK